MLEFLEIFWNLTILGNVRNSRNVRNLSILGNVQILEMLEISLFYEMLKK